MGKGSGKSSTNHIIKTVTKACPGQAKFENYLPLPAPKASWNLRFFKPSTHLFWDI